MSDDIKTFKSIERLLKSINREQTDYRDTLRDNEALLDSILNISQKTAEQNLATSRQELEALKQRHQAIMDNEQRTADEFIEATKLNDMIKEKTESLAKDTVAVKENAKALAQQNASIRTTLGRFKQLTTVYERHEEVNSDLIFRMKDFFLTMGTVRGGIAMSLVALTGLVDSFISLAFSADESSKALARQTGITVEFGDKLAVSRDEVTRFGVSLDDQSKSFQALRSTFTDFSLSNEDLQVKLTNSTAVLNQLGIANQDLAAGFQNTTKFFGQTAEAALDTASDLADFSTNIFNQFFS